MKKRSNNIGQRIREKRLDLGWTQERLAKAVRCSRVYVNKLENAHVPSPGIKVLEKIRVRLGMSWEDLWK